MPLRDLFGLLFFVSVGMLLDPAFLVAHLGTVALVVGLVAVGKGLICGALARLFGYGNVVPLAVGFGMFQIGEFSFVLARVGLNTGSISRELYALVLATALVTIVLTPFAARLVGLLDILRKRWSRVAPVRIIDLPRTGLHAHVVIAGGGRVGQYVAGVLQRLDLGFVVVELDQRRVQECHAAGMPVIYGDASHPVVLEAAAVTQARLLILTVPSVTVAQAIVTQVRQLAPSLALVARAEGVEQMERLHRLGVSEVVQPYFEAGLRNRAAGPVSPGCAGNRHSALHRRRPGRTLCAAVPDAGRLADAHPSAPGNPLDGPHLGRRGRDELSGRAHDPGDAHSQHYRGLGRGCDS